MHLSVVFNMWLQYKYITYAQNTINVTHTINVKHAQNTINVTHACNK